MPCILNAANEIAVQAFLEDRISFLGMPRLIEKCMHSISFIQKPTYEDYVQTNMETRGKALEFLQHEEAAKPFLLPNPDNIHF